MKLSELCFEDTGRQAIPDSEQWFEYRGASGSFRYLLRRFNPQEAERIRRMWTRMDRTSIVPEVDWTKVPGILAEHVVLDIQGILRDGVTVIADVGIRKMLLQELSRFQSQVMSQFSDEEAFQKNAVSGRVLSTTGGAPAPPELHHSTATSAPSS